MMHSSSGPYTQGRSRFDFAVYDSAGRLRAQIEAKANPRATRSWAKQFWNDLEEMERRPSAGLFVLITPLRLFIWNVSKVKSGTPTRTIDAEELLAPYFTRAEILPTEINPAAFEMLVSWWLHDLVSLRTNKQPPSSLSRTGLLQALAEGKVVREEMA
ncbi:hypothetical protein HMI49_25905 [Corallococcus exercitus]|uniref:Uncharacterized protein n=1 Tax=Corallococcus exercitus TaxID=2316736 RepID=A0A7Y4KMQ5_9BACT|nr:hypothetical protein [Corallococcus exercitus]NOK36647.1 hypothetical protein [Corallococcus exercitus]